MFNRRRENSKVGSDSRVGLGYRDLMALQDNSKRRRLTHRTTPKSFHTNDWGTLLIFGRLELEKKPNTTRLRCGTTLVSSLETTCSLTQDTADASSCLRSQPFF